jgi:hypothetical protein
VSEPIKIEPYYQGRAKWLVDHLFDKGYFSDTLSRCGMDDVEGLLALYLQLGAQSAAKCAEMTKKYKVLPGGVKGEPGHERHEEEMRWIARAREAEKLVVKLSTYMAELEDTLKHLRGGSSKWDEEVCAFLKKAAEPPFCVELGEASRLFADAIALGIIPEPDCRPGKEWEVRPTDGCPCPPPEIYPGAVIAQTCPKCGGRITPDQMVCGNIHDSGAGPTAMCALPVGHSGPHESADMREGWG